MYRICVIMCRKNIKKNPSKNCQKIIQNVQTAGYIALAGVPHLELKNWKRLEYCLSIEPLYDGMTELGLGFRGLFWFYRNS